MDLLSEGGSDGSDKYVKRSGDDLLGNLTFDTDKIVLNVDGTVKAQGIADISVTDPTTADGVRLDPAGTMTIGRSADAAAFVIHDQGTTTATISNKGNAIFGDNVTVCTYTSWPIDTTDNYARVYVDGYFYANRTTDTAVVFQGRKEGTTNAEILANGDSTFKGVMTGGDTGSIDGGTYAV